MATPSSIVAAFFGAPKVRRDDCRGGTGHSSGIWLFMKSTFRALFIDLGQKFAPSLEFHASQGGL